MRTSELEKIVQAAQLIILARANKDPFQLDYHIKDCKRPIYDSATPCDACWHEADVRARILDMTGDVAYFEKALAALDWHEQVTELFVPLASFDEPTRAIIIAVHKEKKRLREQAEFNQYHAMMRVERQNGMEVSYDKDGHTSCIKLTDLRGSGHNSAAVRRTIKKMSRGVV